MPKSDNVVFIWDYWPPTPRISPRGCVRPPFPMQEDTADFELDWPEFESVRKDPQNRTLDPAEEPQDKEIQR